MNNQFVEQNAQTGFAGIPAWATQLEAAKAPPQTVADLMDKVNTLTALMTDISAVVVQLKMQQDAALAAQQPGVTNGHVQPVNKVKARGRPRKIR